jgi:hypothetical protein
MKRTQNLDNLHLLNWAIGPDSLLSSIGCFAKRTQIHHFQSKYESRKFIPKGSKIKKRTQIPIPGFSGSRIPVFFGIYAKQSQS